MGAPTRGLERVPEINFVVAVTKVMTVQQYTPSPWKRHVSPLSAPSHSPSFVHHNNLLFGFQKIRPKNVIFFVTSYSIHHGPKYLSQELMNEYRQTIRSC